MGSVSIIFVLSGIEFHFRLAVSVVRIVVLRRGVLGLHLVLPLPLLRHFCEVCQDCCVLPVVAWVPRP